MILYKTLFSISDLSDYINDTKHSTNDNSNRITDITSSSFVY